MPILTVTSITTTATGHFTYETSRLLDSSPTGFHVVYALEHSYTTYSKNSVILITVDTAAVRRAL